MSRFFASCVLLGVIGWAPPVAADRADDAVARQHFEAGSRAFNVGEFQEAVTEYKAAYKVKPDPVFLYNIAQAYRLANDPNHAVFFYRSFLHSAPDAPNRSEVEDRIQKLEAQLAQQRELAAPPNTTVAPTAETIPGEPKLVVSSPPPPSKPRTKPRYWIIGVVAGAAAVVGLGVGLGVGLAPRDPSPTISDGIRGN